MVQEVGLGGGGQEGKGRQPCSRQYILEVHEAMGWKSVSE